MDFKGQNIEDWLLSKHADPNFHTYATNYSNIKQFLLPIHEDVKAVVARIDPKIYLNAHGASHIQMVIEKASLLLSHDEINLSEKEVYFLLLAIQLHDIGHIINGRKTHATDANIIISKISPQNLNQVEKKAIFKIVAAHSGQENDPIGQLPQIDIISNVKIRYRFLAAVLRLADELADGHERASNFLLSINSIPKKSILYHVFSSCLDSFYPDLESHSVRMKFHINSSDLIKKYKKDTSNIYLIDEIYSRTLTTFTECLYYNRFVPEAIRINTIDVEIDFNSDLINSIKYKIKENGYPKLYLGENIFTICETDLMNGLKKIDGAYIHKLIKKEVNDNTKSI